MIFRKYMTWAIIVILFFSLLSFMTTVKLREESKKGNISQGFGDPEFLGLNKEYITENVSESINSDEPELDEVAGQNPNVTMDITELEIQSESTMNDEPELDEDGVQNPFVTMGTNEPEIQSKNPDNTTLQNELNESEEEEIPQIGPETEFSEFESGHLKTVGVAIYSDDIIDNAINWGDLTPGGNNCIECYVKNIGEAISSLSLETANWFPNEATKYIALSWDYDGQSLKVDEIIRVTLTLTVSEKISEITEFFFDIVIIGSST